MLVVSFGRPETTHVFPLFWKSGAKLLLFNGLRRVRFRQKIVYFRQSGDSGFQL